MKKKKQTTTDLDQPQPRQKLLSATTFEPLKAKASRATRRRQTSGSSTNAEKFSVDDSTSEMKELAQSSEDRGPNKETGENAKNA